MLRSETIQDLEQWAQSLPAPCLVGISASVTGADRTRVTNVLMEIAFPGHGPDGSLVWPEPEQTARGEAAAQAEDAIVRHRSDAA
jgi:hypothetical protein